MCFRECSWYRTSDEDSLQLSNMRLHLRGYVLINLSCYYLLIGVQFFVYRLSRKNVSMNMRKKNMKYNREHTVMLSTEFYIKNIDRTKFGSRHTIFIRSLTAQYKILIFLFLNCVYCWNVKISPRIIHKIKLKLYP
jgi:hypothetical protein